MEHSFLKAIVAVLAMFPAASAAAQTFPYLDPELGIDERINDLVPRLSLEEKAAMMQYASPAVPSLGIPAYNWWNECLHGVGRSQDKVTVFPQAIAMAAAFDGYVTSDCGAIDDFYKNHRTHPDAPSSAADAVRHTTDLECGAVYSSLPEAVRQGLITEEEIDESLARLLRIRFRLGNFDLEETDDDTERQSAIIRIKGGPVVLAK